MSETQTSSDSKAPQSQPASALSSAAKDSSSLRSFLADPKYQSILGLVVTVLVCILIVLVLKRWEMVPRLSHGGWYGIAGVCVALFMKILLADWLGQDYKYHKHGCDMCVMAFGTSLTTLAYELSHPQIDGPTMTFLLCLFLLALLGMLRAGLNSAKIEKENNVKHLGLVWANVALGVFAIGLNIFFLVAKDRDSQRVGSTQTVTAPQANEVGK
jgi:hypothetical protein